jgi:hypothetical protein
MAKKEQPKLSYSPNTGLIAGEAQVAASEVGLTNASGAFGQGFGAVFGEIQKANEERDARMEAYEASLPGMGNVNLIQDPANKQIITSFLNKQRDEFNRLAEIWDKTKDRGVKDQMEAVKFSLINLNDQIKTFDEDKMEFRTAFDENQLASVETYDKEGFFTNAFTNNAEMQVGENGDLGFTINNKSYNYKDKAGKWNVDASEEEEFIFKAFNSGRSNGSKGIKMNPDDAYTNMFAGLKRSSASDLQVLATTDLVGDNRSETFRQQFASGNLDPNLYKKIGMTATDGEYDTEWMFDNKNSNQLKTVLAEYFKNVVIDGNTTAFGEYQQKINNKNVTQPQDYVLESRANVNKVNQLIANPKKITMEALWGLNIDSKLRRDITEENGVFKIFDAQDKTTKIDPNASIEQIRGQLYNLVNVRQADVDLYGGLYIGYQHTATKGKYKDQLMEWKGPNLGWKPVK